MGKNPILYYQNVSKLIMSRPLLTDSIIIHKIIQALFKERLMVILAVLKDRLFFSCEVNRHAFSFAKREPLTESVHNQYRFLHVLCYIMFSNWRWF